MPNIEVIYWSMRVMAFTGVLMSLVAAVGAWLYWKRKLEQARWFQRTAIVAIAFPYIAATAGWILTEMGRQPWIVQGLLLTEQGELAKRQQHLARDQPRCVRRSLRHSRDRRLRAHAPLRERRSERP